MDNNLPNSLNPDPATKPKKSLVENNVLMYSILVVVLLGAVVLDGWAYATRHKVAAPVKTVASTTKPSTSSTTTSGPTVPTASDNQSLNTDLNTVNSSLNQSSQDSTSANGAVNDQQQEVTVPTT